MSKALYFIICCIVLIAGCSNSNEKANELYVEASKLYQSKAYRAALEKLDIIIEKYPKSDLAIRLLQGEARFEGYTFHQVRIAVAAIYIRQIGLALDMYAADNGMYPTTEQGLDALIRKPISQPEPMNWIAPYVEPTKFLDPWDTQYIYESPSQHKAYDYDLYSYGADGMEGGGDDIKNW